MIKRDFFVAILDDVFVPASKLMAGRRFLGEEEIVSILEGDDENLSEFSFGESESDIKREQVPNLTAVLTHRTQTEANGVASVTQTLHQHIRKYETTDSDSSHQVHKNDSLEKLFRY
jgi:hypothetical protein